MQRNGANDSSPSIQMAEVSHDASADVQPSPSNSAEDDFQLLRLGKNPIIKVPNMPDQRLVCRLTMS